MSQMLFPSCPSRPSRLSCLLVCALSVIPSVAHAQVGGVVGGVVTAGGQQPRDIVQPSGRSIIRGRVLTADGGQPVRRASVRVTSPQLRGGRAISTDADGRFEFRDLPVGRYTVAASKPAYVGWSYGQTQFSGPGKPVVLADNQAADIDIRLPRGGVIAGRVTDEFGDPVPNASVTALRQQYSEGQRRLTPIGSSTQTNDIGEYRLFGLAPGSYVVSAVVVVQPGVLGLNGNGTSGERTGFAPTYYPAAADSSLAQKLPVGVAQTLTGIDISLQVAQLATISGIAIDSQGQPMTNGSVMTTRRGVGLFGPSPGGALRQDGTFTIANVAPGEYVLRANAFRLPQPGVNPVPQEFSMALVTVNGDDILGVRLAPTLPATITGRVSFDDPGAAASVKGAAIGILAQPLSQDDALAGIGPGGFQQSPTRDDFTFEVKTMSGRIGLRAFAPATPSAAGWQVKSVRVNGVDVTDTGFDVGRQGVSGVEIEMTNRLQQISGTVTDSKGDVVTNYTVLVFSQDRARWALPMNRYFAIARPPESGGFKVGSLPPGEYFAIAVDGVDLNDWQDPERLESLSRLATPFVLTSGDTRTLDLKLAATP
jgi:Carboxypeptidase regulatory-like domain